MADKTTIPWCDYTFNPVWGCTKVDRGCKHCYAENVATRWGHKVWGPTSPFREFDDRQWNKPLQWNKEVGTKLAVLERKDYPGRPRVFPSMCDPFDADWPSRIRDRLWELIRKTPRLDWLLLTKRPENIPAMLPADWGHGWSNVWLVASAHDQESLVKRTGQLAQVPAIVRGISLEPLVGDDVDLEFLEDNVQRWLDSNLCRRILDWFIVGGESGGGADAMPLDAASRVLSQTACLGLPFFMKRFGSVLSREYGWNNSKGEDMSEWPESFRRRQFPFDNVRRCVGCGCHDFHACPGGCSWAGADVCSKCATVEEKL